MSAALRQVIKEKFLVVSNEERVLWVVNFAEQEVDYALYLRAPIDVVTQEYNVVSLGNLSKQRAQLIETTVNVAYRPSVHVRNVASNDLLPQLVTWKCPA